MWQVSSVLKLSRVNEWRKTHAPPLTVLRALLVGLHVQPIPAEHVNRSKHHAMANRKNH